MSHLLSSSTFTKALLAFTFFFELIGALYATFNSELPPIFDLLGRIAVLWLFASWLSHDSRERGESWPLDLGMFLAFFSIFLLPYYLIKNRGVKGLIGIFVYIVVLFAGWFTGIFVAMYLLP